MATRSKDELRRWPGTPDAGARKLKLFEDRLLNLALVRLLKERGLKARRLDVGLPEWRRAGHPVETS